MFANIPDVLLFDAPFVPNLFDAPETPLTSELLNAACILEFILLALLLMLDADVFDDICPFEVIFMAFALPDAPVILFEFTDIPAKPFIAVFVEPTFTFLVSDEFMPTTFDSFLPEPITPFLAFAILRILAAPVIFAVLPATLLFCIALLEELPAIVALLLPKILDAFAKLVAPALFIEF